MNDRTRRLTVLVVVGALICSFALGAAMPAAAGGLLGDDEDSLDSDLDSESADDSEDDGLENASQYGPVISNVSALNVTWVNGSWVNDTELNDSVVNGTTDDDGTAADPVGTPEQTADENGADDPADPDVVDETTESVEAAGERSSDTVDRTTNATGDVVDETTDATGAGADEATNVTDAAVDDAVNATNATRQGGNDSGEMGAGAATDDGETVAETAGSAGASVGATTNSTTGLLEESVDDTTTSVVETTPATNGTADVNAVLDRAVNATTGGVGDLTTTGSVAELQRVLDGTVDLAKRTTETLTGVVERTLEEGEWLLEDAVAGPSGGSEGAVTTEAYGFPVVDAGPSLVAPGGTWSDAGTTEAAGERVTLVDDAGSGADGSGTEESAEDGADVDGSPPGGLDPLGSGAAVGAALLVGSIVASRTAMAGSSMGAGATTLPRALLGVLREYAARLAVLAGYSRYDFDDPLENENRAAVLEAVESSPGINLTSLVESTELSQSTVRYHLQVLEHEGLLEGAKVRGRRRYVPRTDDDVELLAAFEEESTQAVLAALFDHEPATGTTLAEALDRDPSTVSHHLSRLSEAGLVEREQDGPALRNSLTPRVRAALSEVEVTASVQGHAQADD